ncbi:hypothetical protein [Streptomyces sp. NBC_00385]|uniref:hypothetical protein n=1 Tax=Streptomyces sp. NBC_00385 TaxID=2975733 RepID=UPI002DD97D21|nr:hypothetical protein [Streptomyces sp. NBC_00385]WRZ08641.1 hypothetical protein OG959_37480 [Streptomyces sp. NBC_00385]
MNQTSPARRASGRRAARSLTPALLAALIVAGTAACGSDDSSSQGTARSIQTVSPEPARTATATATESPRTQDDFAASVSADVERNRQKAVATLEGVEGKGNAVEDVSVNGLPVVASEQFRSALVRVTNRTDEPAFYAVRVEFVDASGKVLDSVVLGFADAPPDRTVSQHANSRKAAGVKSFPRIAQAERG